MFHKHLRRAVMRYVNLSSVLALRLISKSVEKKFPDYNSLVEAKLLTEEEVKINCTKRHEKFPIVCKKNFHNISQIMLRLSFQAKRLAKVDAKTPHESSWTPLLWAMKLLAKAKEEKRISVEPPSFAQLQGSFEKIENTNRKLLRYGWINFPLSYTQVIRPY